MSLNSVSYSPQATPTTLRSDYPIARQASRRVHKGVKRIWKQFDDDVLKEYFGGSHAVHSAANNRNGDDHRGNYELGMVNGVDEDYGDENEDTFIS